MIIFRVIYIFLWYLWSIYFTHVRFDIQVHMYTVLFIIHSTHTLYMCCRKLVLLHTGLHLPEFAVEYGTAMSCNVLSAELKHMESPALMLAKCYGPWKTYICSSRSFKYWVNRASHWTRRSRVHMILHRMDDFWFWKKYQYHRNYDVNM